MRSTLLSFERHATRAAALALLGTILVGACDHTQPLEPSHATPPASPVLIRGGNTGALALQVTSAANATLLGGSTFKLSNSQNTYVVGDNGNGDADGVAGEITFLAVAPGAYTLCEITAPAGYTILQSSKCKSLNVNVGVTANGGNFPNVHLPTLLVGYVDANNINIGGGAFTAKDSLGTVMTVVDNDANDNDKANGYFSFDLPHDGTWVICESGPPPGYALPAGQSTFCYTQKFTYDTATFMGYYLVVKISRL